MANSLTCRVRARVRLTVEVDAGGVWGSGTTIDQIHKQALDGIEGYVRVRLPKEMTLVSIDRNVRLVAEVGDEP